MEALGVSVVPIPLIVGEEQVRENDLPLAQLFERMDNGAEARTAAPSPGEFQAAFRAAQDSGAPAAVCLVLASRYSATHQSAVLAQESWNGEMPVTVLDTGAIAAVHGFAVEAAAISALEECSVDDIVRAARRVAAQSALVGVLDSVRFAVRSGRVPAFVGTAADFLRIKPVISFSAGKPRLVGRVRTLEQGIAKIANRAASQLGPHECRIVVMHAAAENAATALLAEADRRINVSDAAVVEIPAVMAVHTGPGFVALAGQRRG
jgi:DegV family protein with EDD domain